MDTADREKLSAEQADLTRKLKARSGKPGYAANVRAVQARLGAIAKALADG